MAQHRRNPAQLFERLFMTDSGLETTMVFNEKQELPYFAAFHLLQSHRGTRALRRYYRRHASIALSHQTGFILESATWRASSDWGDKLGYTPASLERANQQAIELLTDLRDNAEASSSPMVISGCVGPRGDGYVAGELMSPQQAQAYHDRQVRTLAACATDLITAVTMTNTAEAIGIVRAAQSADVPVVVSFTVETDGKLPTGESLQQAIAQVDAATDRGPLYYMINCAHPLHFRDVLADEAWARRVRGLRANASKRSHAELDAAPDLDDGNPVEFGNDYAELRKRLPWLNVLGGCCGTDHRHIEQVCLACCEERPSAAPAMVG